MASTSTEEKVALVHFNQRARPLKFYGEKKELQEAFKKAFSDVLPVCSTDMAVTFQIKDEEWGGEFVDILDQPIPPRSQIRAIVDHSPPMELAMSQSKVYTPSVQPTSSSQLNEHEAPEFVSHPAASGTFGPPRTHQIQSVESVQLKLVSGGDSRQLCMEVPHQQDVDVLVEDKQLDQQEIAEQAIIYSRETSRPLSNYQKRMNKASQSLCLGNPGLLRKKRSVLISMAREKIIEEGFQFKKGKTRSKKGMAIDEVPVPKHRKTSKDFRESRLLEIEEKVSDISDRISFKEKQISGCIGIADYEKCDSLKKEIMSLKQDKRELLAEKGRLKVSNRKSAWYAKRKNSASTDCTDSSKETRSTSPGDQETIRIHFTPQTSGAESTHSDVNSPESTLTAETDIDSPSSSCTNVTVITSVAESLEEITEQSTSNGVSAGPEVIINLSSPSSADSVATSIAESPDF